ncbi:NADH:ubiquinone oxidoreductase 20.1kD subunit [Peziza echinospora]|nr:NADH:ubiquinone oxidoreductase 20.1kD subunit [Peziza echinospora]
MFSRRIQTALLRQPFTTTTTLRTYASISTQKPPPPVVEQPGPITATSDHLSVQYVDGVPIVSNYPLPTRIAHLHPTHPDPAMTGGYVNPPPLKRQFRDPNGTYWNHQDRRDYNEPVNEDEDILGRLSPEVYTWTTPRWGFAQNGIFVLAVLGLTGVVYLGYQDKPAVPRRFPYGGLREELGGSKAPAALSEDDE